MVKYLDVKTGEILGEYPPSKEKTIFVVIEREAHEYLEQFKKEQKEYLEQKEINSEQNIDTA